MEIKPNLEEFLKVCEKNNLIVFSYKFFCDYLTPLSIYYQLMKNNTKESFLLESVEGDEKVSQFSFLGFHPLITIKSKNKGVFLKENKGIKKFSLTTDPLEVLKSVMKRYKVWPKKSTRFLGGFVGYLSYDFVRFYEPIGKELEDDINTFDSYFILPKFLIVFDHLHKQIEIFSFLIIGNENKLSKKNDTSLTKKELYFKEIKTLEKVMKKILKPVQLSLLEFHPQNSLKAVSNLKKRDFLKAVEKIKEYIRNGEAIQVVFSQRFKLEFRGDPFLVYRYLRLLNPSPYMYYLNFRDIKIVGSSPEMLLRCINKELITRPIAGTRKRGKNEQEDELLKKDLLADPKERAEHIMLVDLGRNDLGRVAKPKTVTVPIFMKVERFSHVMHIVSEARAILDKKFDLFNALRACFPAGTVSGAPKVRAMQIINELEPQRRGIYAGCIGYFSFTNTLDTCIIIRTIVIKDGYAYVQAGAGIVADSKPENEYKETVNKAKAQILALRLAGAKK